MRFAWVLYSAGLQRVPFFTALRGLGTMLLKIGLSLISLTWSPVELVMAKDGTFRLAAWDRSGYP
jgi:hypothetical protein